MYLLKVFNLSVLIVVLLTSPVASQNKPLFSQFIQKKPTYRHTSDISAEQKRFIKWRTKGYIPVYIVSQTRIPIATEATNYVIDLSKVLEDVLADLRLETFLLAIPEFRVVSQPENGAIWFGLYEDSDYLREHVSVNLDTRFLSRSYGGMTFIIDQNGNALDFDGDYIDAEFEHVECLLANPQHYVNVVHNIRVAGRDRWEIEVNSPIERIELAMRAIAKHELYHALGAKHTKNCTPTMEGRRNCSVMASNAEIVFSYPGPVEFEQLGKIWK
jgi:hypothetical protein